MPEISLIQSSQGRKSSLSRQKIMNDPEALQGAFSLVSSRLSKGFRCSLINSLKKTTGHLAMLGLIKGKDSIGWS